jgi:hypothetical protein
MYCPFLSFSYTLGRYQSYPLIKDHVTAKVQGSIYLELLGAAGGNSTASSVGGSLQLGLTGGCVTKEVEGADTFLDFLGAFLQLDVLPFSFLFLHIRKVSAISL